MCVSFKKWWFSMIFHCYVELQKGILGGPMACLNMSAYHFDIFQLEWTHLWTCVLLIRIRRTSTCVDRVHVSQFQLPGHARTLRQNGSAPVLTTEPNKLWKAWWRTMSIEHRRITRENSEFPVKHPRTCQNLWKPVRRKGMKSQQCRCTTAKNGDTASQRNRNDTERCM